MDWRLCGAQLKGHFSLIEFSLPGSISIAADDVPVNEYARRINIRTRHTRCTMLTDFLKKQQLQQTRTTTSSTDRRRKRKKGTECKKDQKMIFSAKPIIDRSSMHYFYAITSSASIIFAISFSFFCFSNCILIVWQCFQILQIKAKQTTPA